MKDNARGDLGSICRVDNSSSPALPLPAQVTKTKISRDLVFEVVLSMVASVLLGLGSLFLLLWTGVYV